MIRLTEPGQHPKLVIQTEPIDEHDQVIDVLLREKRDLESADAFFEQAVKRRAFVPTEVVTGKHRGYLRAVRQHPPKARHIDLACIGRGR